MQIEPSLVHSLKGGGEVLQILSMIEWEIEGGEKKINMWQKVSPNHRTLKLVQNSVSWSNYLHPDKTNTFLENSKHCLEN